METLSHQPHRLRTLVIYLIMKPPIQRYTIMAPNPIQMVFTYCHHRSPAHFTQFSGLVWVALAIVAVVTGLRKFQLLNQQARSMAIPAQVPGAVVGTPIGTTDDGKVM